MKTPVDTYNIENNSYANPNGSDSAKNHIQLKKLISTVLVVFQLLVIVW